MLNKLPGFEILLGLKSCPVLHFGQQRLSMLESMLRWDIVVWV